MTTTLSKYLSKSTAMDASWEESKHHRADNGRFTSGSGRGRAGGAEEKVKRKGEGEGSGSGGREEMTEDRAEKVIRTAFKDAKQDLKGLKLVNRAMNAEVLEADEGSCEKVNEYLKKHGLKAKIMDKTTYKIAEDGYDDMQVVDDPMLTVLVLLCAVGLSAKDLHYRAKGRPFYGLHELADVVWQIEHASDDLNEVYYMGEKGDVPPDRAFVAAKASEQVGQAGGMDDILTRLTGLVDALAKAVETAKKPGVASGTAAVLDDISKKSLQAKGLLIRTQKDIEKSAANQAAIDKVVGRGVVLCGGETTAQDSGTHEGAVKAAQTRKAHGGGLSDQHKEDAVRAIAGRALHPAVCRNKTPEFVRNVRNHSEGILNEGLSGSWPLKEHVRDGLIRAYRKLGPSHPASAAIKSSLNSKGVGIFRPKGEMFKHNPWLIMPHDYARQKGLFEEM